VTDRSLAALIVFAKAPVAGSAKTRLIPVLGPAGAAALAERMLEQTVEMATSSGLAHVELCVTPNADHPSFRRMVAMHGIAISVQGEGDLGDRMNRAFNRLLTQHGRVLLIGTDAPSLDHAVVRQAVQALNDHDVVVVPALDGGYALIGLTVPQPDLFRAMPWSSDQVMALTRARAKQSGLQLVELEAVADIDQPEDLVHLPQAWR
jgi:uncharacterized protein